MADVRRKANRLRKVWQELMPDAHFSVSHTKTDYGQSSYIYMSYEIRAGKRMLARLDWEVRVSDHQIGMRRFNEGKEDFHLHASCASTAWQTWISEKVKEYERLRDSVIVQKQAA